MVPRQRWRLVALVREADTEAEETARKEKLEVVNIIITETDLSYFDKTANNSNDTQEKVQEWMSSLGSKLEEKKPAANDDKVILTTCQNYCHQDY